MGCASFGAGNNTGWFMTESVCLDGIRIPPLSLTPANWNLKVMVSKFGISSSRRPRFSGEPCWFSWWNPIQPLLTINYPFISLEASSPTSYQLDKLGRAPIFIPKFFTNGPTVVETTPGSRDDDQGMGGSPRKGGRPRSPTQKIGPTFDLPKDNPFQMDFGGWFSCGGNWFFGEIFLPNHDGELLRMFFPEKETSLWGSKGFEVFVEYFLGGLTFFDNRFEQIVTAALVFFLKMFAKLWVDH